MAQIRSVDLYVTQRSPSVVYDWVVVVNKVMEQTVTLNSTQDSEYVLRFTEYVLRFRVKH